MVVSGSGTGNVRVLLHMFLLSVIGFSGGSVPIITVPRGAARCTIPNDGTLSLKLK